MLVLSDQGVVNAAAAACDLTANLQLPGGRWYQRTRMLAAQLLVGQWGFVFAESATIHIKVGGATQM